MTGNPAFVPRDTSEIREFGNRLRGEPSLYLRQHAHNPIEWHPWGEEAHAEARRRGVPIFLSVGYSSCHWCHVMEDEVFAHDEVAEALNRDFVSIKVDREERPDLDAVFMDAVQALTGRGGWPMSVFLTPDLKPFFGGTYFPREHFLQLIARICQAWRDDPDQLREQADLVTRHAAATPDWIGGGEQGAVELDNGLLAGAAARAREVYDPTYGGFRQQQKFPTPVKWRFLLHEYRRTGDDDLRGMLIHTLEAFQGGGLRDHVGGGFHRYTVDPYWTVPHFEKMLYDNAQLAGLFVEAGAALGRDDFTATGLDALDFLLREMRGPEGAFYASFDADSGGEEGTYYVWSPAEILAVAGPQDGPLLAALLGVTEQGNFEHTGKSVLTQRADVERLAADHGRTPDEARALFGRWRGDLREVRSHRTPPGLDPKILTAWNGLAIAALAQGHAVSGDPRYLEAAERAAAFLLDRHLGDDGALVRTSCEGRAAGAGMLDDYAFLAEGLLELHQVSEGDRWLRAALGLAATAQRLFHREEGGFHLQPEGAEAPLGRTAEWFDSVTPSGGASLLRTLVRLAAVTGETEPHAAARRHLEACGGLLARAGLEAAWWLDAMAGVVHPFRGVVVAGRPGAPDTEALRRAFLAALPHDAVLTILPAAGAAAWSPAPPALREKSTDGPATAWICELGSCLAPVTDPAELLSRLGLQGS